MALNPNKWTTKVQEAFTESVDLARSNGNPEVTPEHVLLVLLGQADTVVSPVLQKLGKTPAMVREDVEGRVGRQPKVTGGSEPRLGRELTKVMDDADDFRKELRDDFLSAEHLLV